MAKSTYKPRAYVEPPPADDSSDPGRGVWSDTSDIAVVDNTRGALRQAIHDALYRLPPDIAKAVSLRVLPSEMQFDAWTTVELRLRTPWWRARQWTRQILRSRWGEPLPEESAVPRPYITGTAELHVERSWRFDPGYQPRDVVREGIRDDFTRRLDYELDRVYADIKSIRAHPSSRRKLDRDATRLVLRNCLGLSDDQIKDYEAGYPVTLDGGQILEHPYVDPDAEEPGLLDPKAERQERDTIDKSIKNLAHAAGITLPPRQRGRPPNLPPLDDPNRDYLA